MCAACRRPPRAILPSSPLALPPQAHTGIYAHHCVVCNAGFTTKSARAHRMPRTPPPQSCPATLAALARVVAGLRAAHYASTRNECEAPEEAE